jgi:hypothetical protein
MGLDGTCPYRSGILAGMNHEALGTSDAALRSEAGNAIVIGGSEMAAVTDRRYTGEGMARGPADGVHACPTFDAVKASQARSDLIKATIIFFGLDGECPSLSCKVTPCL